MARFAQYAMVASEEALKDAGWQPNKDEDLEATVRIPAPHVQVLHLSLQGVYIGSGIGNLDDIYDTTIAYEKGVSRLLCESLGG